MPARKGPAPIYRTDLALVHHLGFGAHADACADGVLQLLAPVRRTGGLVLELGCGSGRLTRHLVAAGHRVLATDASPAMLELAAAEVTGAYGFARLALPDDPLPPADAIVGVGHVLNYLPDERAVERAWQAIAGALRPDGLLGMDLCDLRWGAVRQQQPDAVRVEPTWALFTRFSLPGPTRSVRTITTFVQGEDGSWRRDDERHDNVLVEAAEVPQLLARFGVQAAVQPSFGTEVLPDGLVAVVGRKSRT